MRTEQEILKDFEKLGYKEQIRNGSILILQGSDVSLEINTEHKWFRSCEWSILSGNTKHSWYFDMKDHKLLHELFECWGWLE